VHELDDGLGRNFGFAAIGFLSLIIGNGASGIGQGQLVIGGGGFTRLLVLGNYFW